MAQFNLRRAAASFLLVSALSLVPAGTASAGVRSNGGREDRAVAARSEARRPWLVNLVVTLLEKMAVRIDPDGNH
ncbi:MAG: hypothetical protein ACJ75H_03060 [Thermoanaerobaculia bacterium]